MKIPRRVLDMAQRPGAQAVLRALLHTMLILLLLAAGAVQTPGSVTGELLRAKQRWTDTGIRNYQFTLGQLCECLTEEDLRVVVKDGVVASASYTPSGRPVDAEGLAYAFSIDTLFDMMVANYTQHKDKPGARVTWQPNVDYHYPEQALIDPDRSVPDAAVTYYIRDFSH